MLFLRLYWDIGSIRISFRGYGCQRLQEPRGMGYPLFRPAPFIALGLHLKVDATAITISIPAGYPIRYTSSLRSMTEVGAHVGNIIFTKLV